jgi:hypothetical protein
MLVSKWNSSWTNTPIVSPTRTYVAVCNKTNFDGHYFRKFTLPDKVADVPVFAQAYDACHHIRNDAEFASWYFLNVLDGFSCIDGCITFEDYQDFQEVKQ